MAISDAQKELRANRIGSSDSVRIMAGRWAEVWREKTGRADPPNLDFVAAVQIGVATEHLHAKFYLRATGIPCVPAGERTYVHPERPYLVAHLDFLTWTARGGDPCARPDAVLEAKFSSGYEADEDLVERYYWQLQHQMLVSGLRSAILSVLRPSGHSFVPVAWSEADGAVLLQTLETFWWHVENGVEPGDLGRFDPPAAERARILDMSMHNEFAALAWDLMDRRDDVRAYRAAETRIKSIMPEGARIAFLPGRGTGGGLILTRGRDGRLTLRFGELPRGYRERVEPWLPEFAQAAGDQ